MKVTIYVDRGCEVITEKQKEELIEELVGDTYFDFNSFLVDTLCLEPRVIFNLIEDEKKKVLKEFNDFKYNECLKDFLSDYEEIEIEV